MLFMPKIYLSSKRGHVKSLKGNPQIAIKGKGRSVGASYVRGCRLLETIPGEYYCKFLWKLAEGEELHSFLAFSIRPQHMGGEMHSYQ